jgi:hypothetical protein
MKKMKMKQSAITDLLVMVAGGIAAAKLSNVKLPVNLPAPIQSGLPLIVGGFLSTKKGMIGNLGKGMAVVGGMKLVNTLVPSLGVGASPFIDDQSIDAAYQINGSDYALAGAMMQQSAPVGNTSYALAGVDQKDSDIFG